MSYRRTRPIHEVLREPVLSAFEEIGEKEVLSIKASLSIPVTRDENGNVIERSAPGEAPRMDDDILRQNIEHVTLLNEDGVPELDVLASRPPHDEGDQSNAAEVLEFGGTSAQGRYVAPRPFMRPAADRIAEYAADVLSQKISEHLT